MKKRIAALLAMSMLFGAAQARTYPINTWDPNRSLLVDENGTVLIPAGVYSSLSAITPEGTSPTLYQAAPVNYADYPSVLKSIKDEEARNIANAQSEEEIEYMYMSPRLCLLDENGTLLSDFLYSYFIWHDNVSCIVAETVDKTYHVLDSDGNLLFETDGYSVVPTTNGNWFYTVNNADNEDLYDLMVRKPDGTSECLGTEYESGWMDRLADDLILMSSGIVMDEDGNERFRIDPYNDSLSTYVNDRSILSRYIGEDYIRQLVDKSGNVLMDGMDDLYMLEDGRVLVTDGSMIALYGEDLTAPEFSTDTGMEIYYAYSYGPYFVVEGTDDAQYYFMDGSRFPTPESSDMYIDAHYSPCRGEPDRYVMYSDGKYCLIDTRGNVMSDRYDYLYTLAWCDDHGYYCLWNTRSTRVGLMDDTGKMLLPCNMDRIQFLSEDRILVNYNDKYVMMDLDMNPLFTMSDYSMLID